MRKALLLVLVACGPTPQASIDASGGIDADLGPDAFRPDAGPPCAVPPTPANPADVTVAAQYASAYTVYDLGAPPGVPNPLGGAVVSHTDPDTLLIAGSSESTAGAIYAIGVTRGACGHITGWSGTATQVAATPYVDANLVYVDAAGLMLYTEWPQFYLSQLSPGGNAPARRTELTAIGMAATGDQGPGGLGLVPSNLASGGELRTVTWPVGTWYHVTAAPNAGLLDVTAVTSVTTLPNNPGGFAYVPAGSPEFATQAIIVAEWVSGDPTQDRVAVYDADASGDPIVSTRREFLSKFPRPWGAYFEPMTGDYLFLSWGTGSDRVFVVQGFVPPPPID